MKKRNLMLGAFLLFVLAGSFIWRSSIPRRVLPAPSRSAPSPGTDRGATKADGKPKASAEAVDPRRFPDPKKALAALLTSRVPGSVFDTVQYGTADALSDLVFGDDDSFRKLVREAKNLLGDKYGPTVQALLGDMKSPTYRSVLLLMLGAGQGAEALPALKSFLAEGKHSMTMAAAAYGIGLIPSDEAFAFLKKYHDTIPAREQDLAGLRKVVQAALAANGERSIPMLLEGLKADAAEQLATSGAPKNYELALPAFHDEWLAHLRVDHVPQSLRDALSGTLEPRVRFNILSALAENKTADVYKYLADTFRESSDPLVKSSVVQAIRTALSSPGEQASKQSEEIRSSMGAILREASSAEHLSFPMTDALVRMACKLDTEQSLQWLDGLLKRDLTAAYGDEAGPLRHAIAWNLGFAKSADPLLQTLIKSSPDSDEAAVLQADYYRNTNVRFNNAEAARSLLASLAKLPPESGDYFRRLLALERTSVETGAVAAAIQRAYLEAEEPSSRLRLLLAGGNLGPASSSFLESVIQSQDGLALRVQAACQLMRVSSDEDLRDRLWAPMNSILAPVNKIGGDVFYTMSAGRNLYGNLIRDYYSRFGTPQDIPLLESIPTMVTFESRAPADWVEFYQSTLRMHCLQAQDAIALKGLSK